MDLGKITKLVSRIEDKMNFLNFWLRFKHTKVRSTQTKEICPKPPKQPQWKFFRCKRKVTKEKKSVEEEPCVYRK